MSDSRAGMAPGQINGPEYFINRLGEIQLPPSTEEALRIKDRMSQRGFDLRKVTTLQQLDDLQNLMAQQHQEQNQQDAEREDLTTRDRLASARARLRARMVSSSTSPYERDFIQYYLQLSDDRKREQYRQRFLCDTAYFMAREFDDGGSAKIAQIEQLSEG